MIKYIANTNTTVICVYGTYNITVGNEYPYYLYKMFKRYFDIVNIPEVELNQETLDVISEPNEVLVNQDILNLTQEKSQIDKKNKRG